MVVLYDGHKRGVLDDKSPLSDGWWLEHEHVGHILDDSLDIRTFHTSELKPTGEFASRP